MIQTAASCRENQSVLNNHHFFTLCEYEGYEKLQETKSVKLDAPAETREKAAQQTKSNKC